MALFVCGDPSKDGSANPARLSGLAEGDPSLKYWKDSKILDEVTHPVRAAQLARSEDSAHRSAHRVRTRSNVAYPQG